MGFLAHEVWIQLTRLGACKTCIYTCAGHLLSSTTPEQQCNPQSGIPVRVHTKQSSSGHSPLDAPQDPPSLVGQQRSVQTLHTGPGRRHYLLARGPALALASEEAGGGPVAISVRHTQDPSHLGLSWTQNLTLVAFIVEGGEFVEPPAASSRRIEFLGDSLTAGHGAGAVGSCRGSVLRNDFEPTWVSLLCQNFSADCHVQVSLVGRSPGRVDSRCCRTIHDLVLHTTAVHLAPFRTPSCKHSDGAWTTEWCWPHLYHLALDAHTKEESFGFFYSYLTMLFILILHRRRRASGSCATFGPRTRTVAPATPLRCPIGGGMLSGGYPDGGGRIGSGDPARS
jgi:hypothetical protein